MRTSQVLAAVVVGSVIGIGSAIGAVSVKGPIAPGYDRLHEPGQSRRGEPARRRQKRSRAARARLPAIRGDGRMEVAPRRPDVGARRRLVPPDGPSRLHLPLDHHLLDLGDRLRRVEALRAGLGAVHDGVAAIEPERIFEIVEPLAGRFIAAVDDPAVGLQQRGGAEIAIDVPPVARARGRAAGAQDALVEAVELVCDPRGSASIPSPASASRSAATARSRRTARRNSSGPAPDPSPPACAAADRS